MSADRRAATSQMIVSMMAEPTSLAQLALITGSTEDTVSAWIKSFRKFKLTHIADWAPDARGYLTIPLHRWGSGDDVPAPAKTSAERVREYRKRQKEKS